jgi:hypothetical protein
MNEWWGICRASDGKWMSQDHLGAVEWVTKDMAYPFTKEGVESMAAKLGEGHEIGKLDHGWRRR